MNSKLGLYMGFPKVERAQRVDMMSDCSESQRYESDGCSTLASLFVIGKMTSAQSQRLRNANTLTNAPWH